MRSTTNRSKDASTKRLRLFEVPFDQDTLWAIAEVLESGNVMMGAKVEELEEKIADHQDVDPDQVVALNSCSTALDLALGCTPAKNYKILIPGLTHISTINAIQRNGMLPKIVDVGRDLQVNTEILEEAWDPEVGGVVCVDYGGRCPDMPAIMDWAMDGGKQMFVWADCSHSYGSGGYDWHAGELAHISCFSMYPTKPLPGIGGGLLVNNLEDQPRFSRIPRELRYYGITNRSPAGYDVERLGGNYYMSDIQAAVALSFLEPEFKVGEFISKRTYIASLYHEELEDRDLKKEIKPTRFIPEHSTYHLFPVILDKRLNRVALQYSLSEGLIQTGTHYIPLHKFSLYAHALRGPTPYLDSIADSILTLPCHHGMTEEDVVRVVDELERFVKGNT